MHCTLCLRRYKIGEVGGFCFDCAALMRLLHDTPDPAMSETLYRFFMAAAHFKVEVKGPVRWQKNVSKTDIEHIERDGINFVVAFRNMMNDLELTHHRHPRADELDWRHP